MGFIKINCKSYEVENNNQEKVNLKSTKQIYTLCTFVCYVNKVDSFCFM
jgi:hypothetical protein